MKKEYWYLLGGIVIGLVAAPQLKRIPGVKALPTL
jgi:hypothetical protein